MEKLISIILGKSLESTGKEKKEQEPKGDQIVETQRKVNTEALKLFAK